jgi:transposase
VAKGSGLTRGDRRRNDRIERVRSVVRRDHAVLGIDLGEEKQLAALLDHEGRVLGRRKVTAKAYGLGALLGWARELASRHGFAGVVVGCEPTGHRWKALMGLADAAGAGFVCVQPLRVHLAREEDDYTRDKTDHKDSVLIGKLVARLDCYLPERAGADWARLRHLGQRRNQLLVDLVACRQQIADLLGCCWPAVLDCAARPLEAMAWLSCLAVLTRSCDGDPVRARGLGREGFQAAVRVELPRFGGQRLNRAIVGRFFDAAGDAAGVPAQRPGGLERVGLLLDDLVDLTARLSDVESRMVGALDAMGLTGLVGSIPGLSPVGAAAILAETGDLSRFATGRSVVKHAGLNPTERTSATLRGVSRISRRGRPALRLAAYRAAWAAVLHNPVLAARFTHLTTRERDRLTTAQARIACAATLLRWLYAIITRRQQWNPDIATGRLRATQPDATLAAAA